MSNRSCWCWRCKLFSVWAASLIFTTEHRRHTREFSGYQYSSLLPFMSTLSHLLSQLSVRLSFPPCVETVPRLLESVTDSSPRKLPSFSFFFFCPLLFFTPTLHTLTHILPVKSVLHRWIGTVIYKFGAAYRGVCIETGEHSRPGDISYFQFPDALSQRDITADA